VTLKDIIKQVIWAKKEEGKVRKKQQNPEAELPVNDKSEGKRFLREKSLKSEKKPNE